MTAIIIGANGQDGYYLSELLKENGVSVVGVSKRGDFISFHGRLFLVVIGVRVSFRTAFSFFP